MRPSSTDRWTMQPAKGADTWVWRISRVTRASSASSSWTRCVSSWLWEEDTLASCSSSRSRYRDWATSRSLTRLSLNSASFRARSSRTLSTWMALLSCWICAFSSWRRAWASFCRADWSWIWSWESSSRQSSWPSRTWPPSSTRTSFTTPSVRAATSTSRSARRLAVAPMVDTISPRRAAESSTGTASLALSPGLPLAALALASAVPERWSLHQVKPAAARAITPMVRYTFKRS